MRKTLFLYYGVIYSWGIAFANQHQKQEENSKKIVLLYEKNNNPGVRYLS